MQRSNLQHISVLEVWFHFFTYILESEFQTVSFRHSNNAHSESLILNAISTDLWICGPPGRERHSSHKSNTLPHSWLCSLLLQGASVAGCTWSKYLIVWTNQDPRVMNHHWWNLSLSFHNGRKSQIPFHELDTLSMALEGQIETAKPGNECLHHIRRYCWLG